MPQSPSPSHQHMAGIFFTIPLRRGISCFLAQVPCHPVPYSWAFAKLHRCCCLQVGFGRITRLRDSSNDFHVFFGGMKWLIDRIRLNRFHWTTMFFWDCLQNTKYSIVYWRTTNTDMSNIEMGVREVLKLTWGTPRVQSKVKTHWWYDDHDPPSRRIQKIGSLQDWGGSSCAS